MIIISVVIAIVLGGLLALMLTPLPTWLVNKAVDRFLEEPLEARITIGDVGGNLLQRLSFEDVDIRMEDGPFDAHIEAISLQYDWQQLAMRRWHLQRLGLQNPVLSWSQPQEKVPRTAAQRAEAKPAEMPSLPPFEVDHLTITGGHLERAGETYVDRLGLEISLRGEGDRMLVQIIRGHLLWPGRNLSLSRLTASLAVTPEAFEILQFRAATPASRLDLQGWAKSVPAFSCSLEVSAEARTLQELTQVLGLEDGWEGDLSLTARVHRKEDLAWRGDIRLHGRILSYDISELSSRFVWQGQKLELDRFTLQSAGAKLQGRGRLEMGEKDQGFWADMMLQRVDLSAMWKQAPASHLNGRLLVTGSGLSQQTLQASADLDLVGGRIAGRTFEGIRGQIRYDRGYLSVDQGLEVTLEGAQLFLAGSMDVNKHLRCWAEVEIEDVGRLLGRPQLSGTLNSRCQAIGPAADPALAGQLSIKDLRDGERHLQSVKGSFGLSGAVSRQEGFFSLSFAGGAMGALRLDHGYILGRFAGQKILLDSMFVESPEGRCSATAELNLAEGGLAVMVSSLKGSYRGYDFLNSEPLKASYAAGLARLEESELLLPGGSIRMQGTVGPDSLISGWARLRDVQLEPISQLLPMKHQLHGPISLDVAVDGTPQNPVIETVFQWRGGRFNQLDFDELRSQLAYASGRLTLEELQLRRNNSVFTAKGYLPVDVTRGKLLMEENWEMTFSGEGSSAGFLSVLAKEVEDIDGPFAVRFQATGSPRQPRYEGFFNLRDGTLKLASMGNAIEKLSVRAHLDGNYIVLDKIEGQTPFRERNLFKRIWAKLFSSRKRGRFEAFGRINIADPAFDLTMEGRRMYLNYQEEQVEVEADARLRVTGQKKPLISGQVTLRRCLISRSMSTPPRVVGAAEPPAYDVDLNVTIPKNCWLRNEAANIELRGQIRVLQQDGQLSLLGDLETLRGTYFFYGNSFRIQRGLVTFDELAEINPGLNVEAWTEVEAERINLTIGGRLRSPTVTLTSSSGYSEGDIIALLTLHHSPAGLDTLGAQEVLRAQALGFFGSFLQEEISRKAGSTLGVDKFSIEPGSLSGLGIKGAELTLGTYLSSRIYVEYSRRLSQESGEQVGVEYSLSRNLSLLGNRNKDGLYRLGLSFKWDY